MPSAPPFGQRDAHLQRDRLAADVPAGAAQAGAADARPSRGGRELDPFLVRDGGAVARDGARARLQTAAGEDAQKPFVEVSGRKGLGVKVDDLLDLLTAKATRRSGEAQSGVHRRRARAHGAQIAVAAIRYFMLKFSRGKLIVFDIEEALSFEGETGPYLQYAVVRANNIFHKLQEREGVDRSRRARRRSTALPADELDAEATRATARPVGAGVRGVAARRDGRTGGAVARVLGAGEIRVRAGADCSTPSIIGIRSSTKRTADGSAGARRASRTCATQLDARARPDGHRSARDGCSCVPWPLIA